MFLLSWYFSYFYFDFSWLQYFAVLIMLPRLGSEKLPLIKNTRSDNVVSNMFYPDERGIQALFSSSFFVCCLTQITCINSRSTSHKAFFVKFKDFIIIITSWIRYCTVDGVGRISYGHCLYYASPFCSITCILFPQSIFFISFSICFFHVCFGLPLLPLTSNFKAFAITFSSSFLKT